MSIPTQQPDDPFQIELFARIDCPFCQRVAILLAEKNLPHARTEVAKNSKPAWLLDLSASGKIPIVRLNNKEILTESLIIATFLDEISPPSLRPTNALGRAQEAIAIEKASPILGILSQLSKETDFERFKAKKEELKAHLVDLESLMQTPKDTTTKKDASTKNANTFFGTSTLHFIDLMVAPTLLRLLLVEEFFDATLLSATPLLCAWAKNLALRPSISDGMGKGFRDLYKKDLLEAKGLLVQK